VCEDNPVHYRETNILIIKYDSLKLTGKKDLRIINKGLPLERGALVEVID
jgi:hypothetical protein